MGYKDNISGLETLNKHPEVCFDRLFSMEVFFTGYLYFPVYLRLFSLVSAPVHAVSIDQRGGDELLRVMQTMSASMSQV